MSRKVKALLVEKGISQTAIAAELNVLVSTVSGVINGHHESIRIKEHIAKRLQKPYSRLWGKAA